MGRRVVFDLGVPDGTAGAAGTAGRRLRRVETDYLHTVGEGDSAPATGEPVPGRPGLYRMASAPALHLRHAGAGVYASEKSGVHPSGLGGRGAAAWEDERGYEMELSGRAAASAARVTDATDALMDAQTRIMSGSSTGGAVVPGVSEFMASEMETARRMDAWESDGGVGTMPLPALPNEVTGRMLRFAEADASRRAGFDVGVVFDEINREAVASAVADEPVGGVF